MKILPKKLELNLFEITWRLNMEKLDVLVEKGPPWKRVDYFRFQESFKTILFSDVEKRFEMRCLMAEIKKRKVDKEMIPFLERLNNLPWLFTRSSCTGHDGRSRINGSHIVIRIKKPIEKFFEILQPFVIRYNELSKELTDFGSIYRNVVQVFGLENNQPAFRINFHLQVWKEEIELFTTLMENYPEEKQNEL
jgi:hypothetical protein